LQDFAIAQPEISGYAPTHVNNLSQPAQSAEERAVVCKIKPEKAYKQPEQGVEDIPKNERRIRQIDPVEKKPVPEIDPSLRPFSCLAYGGA
jgi:hypothetical protein